MKKSILTLVLISVILLTYGQIETKFYPNKNALEQVKTIRNHPKASKVKTFPAFDAQKLINEDKLNEGLDIPFRFGKGFDTNITLDDGEWTNVEGGSLWSMEFQSKEAYSINFVFNQFYLPDSAELYISNESGTMLYGPVTSKQNTKNGIFLTDLVQGDDVTIYLFEPKEKIGKSQLTIQRVVHAYKNLFPMSYGNLGGSESCNNNIACFPAWDEESEAVALVLLSDGTEWCSGSLVMTAGQTFEPYFLSAFHCIDTSHNGSLSSTEISNAENWMFKFQYKMTSCGGSTATTGITYNGATFRAAWNSSDFALMEMDNSPLGDTQFSWLGWDRSGNTPTSGTGIHHPSGDVMKISFEENQFQMSSWGGTNNHWLLSFDDGVVEHGSSGAPILDQNNRVVGQLHGSQNYTSGLSYCDQPRAEYGRFNVSWTGGGTNTTRLSNWLDPCVSGAVTTNTSRSPYISGPSLVCSSGTSFSVDNLPPGATISWDQSSNISRSSSQGANPCTFASSGSGTGWIEATVTTDCGDIILPQKTIWSGVPRPYWTDPYSVKHYDNVSNEYCYYEQEYITLQDDSPQEGNLSYTWIINDPDIVEVVSMNTVLFKANEVGNFWFHCLVTNTCGSKYIHFNMSVDYCYSFLLAVTPNPSAGETTIAIEEEETNGHLGDKRTHKKEFDMNTDWDLEIYNQSQQLKYKKSKLKGKEHKLNTSSWKEGVYVVRVKYKGEVLTEKLVVK